MSELLVNTIKKADGSGSLTVPAESGTVVTTASPSLGRRNLIINGGQVIDQRNGGASVTPTDGQYVTDRFNADASQASKFTAQQVTDAPTGFSNSLKITSSSAYTPASGDYFDIQQKIEGYSTSPLNLGTANAEAITLSFYVKSSLTGTFGGSIANSAYNRGYPFTYTISSADTWERKTITLTGDTTGTWIGATNGIGLRLHWSIGIGTTYAGTAGAWAAGLLLGATGQTNVVATSGATWQITGVQLEVGSVATPFEHRGYGEELAACMRYYQIIQEGAGSRDTGGGLSVPGEQLIGTGYCHASNRVMGSYRYPHPMRAVPSSAISSASHFSVLHPTNIWSSATTMNIRTTDKYARLDLNGVSVTAGYATEIRIEASTNGKIEFDAEL